MANDDELRLLSHHPRGLNNDDLGFADYAHAICEILADLTTDKTGMTVGIFGDWGSGKSTMLAMVAERLKGAEKPGKEYLIIKFDAWRYGKQEEIWVAFLRTILKQIENELGPLRTWWVNLNRWGVRLDGRKIIAKTISFVIRLLIAALLIFLSIRIIDVVLLQLQEGAFTQQIDWLEGALRVASAAAVIWLIFASFVRGIGRAIKLIFSTKLDVPTEILRPPLDNQQLFVVDQFRDDLTRIIKIIGKVRPIVVLVDDLDRAPIDQIVPVLEAIKHFEFQPDNVGHVKRAPIAFVLAADRRTIERAIASHYEKIWSRLGEPGIREHYAREYLEKIVQFFFEIPPLSPLQLNKLFGEESSSQQGALSWARREARQVFTQGPKQKPREVIGAYNTFQSVWRILQKRGLNNTTSPQLLAALVLTHYIWPEIFEQIVRYPELFFDLHAVATTEPNRVCTRTEIEEILSMGCPSSDPGAMVESIRRDHPDLLRLIAAAGFPESLDRDDLYKILTLMRDQRAPQGRHLIEVSQALMSGDPSLIKFTKRVRSGEIERERVAWLMEFLTERASEVCDDKTTNHTDSLAEHSEQEMIKALFALGRIEDARAVDPLIQVINRRSHYRETVVTRTLFALAHLSKTVPEAEKVKISKEVESLLDDEHIPLAFRLRTLRLFSSSLIDQQKVRHLLIRLALRGEMKLIRDTALIYAGDGTTQDRQGIWLVEALKELKASSPSQEVFESYFHLVARFKGSSLPSDVRFHLIELATEPNSIHTEKAFDILTNFHDPVMAMEYMSDIATRTVDKEFRDRSIMQIGHRQSMIEWRDDVWRSLKQSVARGAPEDREILMRALGVTSRSQAIPYLIAGLNDRDVLVRKAAIEGLEKTAKNDTEAAADAQVALDELGE